ncbi:anthranilate phosphoribosyltransferase [Dermacoccus abyssi]|uniref:anthranilate phosphoribosyltransferase n=1 Tax=Dermacoccus abyssi TaxID=322596 RepID=UPI0021A5B3E5|nr:anthranilate phosphoribosyltransferase [Dermacoccus abyssi]MCT1985556.1 anthranilate phosphoribosyltransferase [Dermacoccus abyssi]
MQWPQLVSHLVRGEDLSYEQARGAMDAIMSGEVSPVRMAAFLVALHSKGETVQELQGLADVMVEHARALEVPGPTLDIVGTGGDMAHTVNISTMASLVCAGAGVRVAKHGNRASSSSTGTADVLEALGVDLTTEPERLQAEALEAPMTFLFAQLFHPAMRHAATTRRELAVPTAFNFLGPLTNPVRPAVAAVGCANKAMAPVMAGVFAERGTDAAVFRGDDGLDELTLATTSTVWWVFDGAVEEHVLGPQDVGLETAPLEALRGGQADENAEVVRRLLAGDHGPVRDAVLFNAGLALTLTEQQASGERFGGRGDLAEAVRAGVARGAEAIDSGAAARVLDGWVERSRSASR